MKILLSDGSGLTSRQVCTVLGSKGHEVHVLCPSGITLTKFTGWVRKVHRVPPFGPNPYSWLTSAIAVMIDERPDMLICTQEQVAVVSAEIYQIRDLGIDIKVAVPKFDSLKVVLDKILARQTLTELDLPQPESVVASSVKEVVSSGFSPAFIKTPIGTGSIGVRQALTTEDLERIGNEYEQSGSFRNHGHLLVQKAIQGPLLMISSVFSHGTLVAWHACLREREGSGGGASVKSSLPLPIIQGHLVKLGQHLDWNGALSLDAILYDGSPKYIDINPRLVEPINALYAGVDLVEALMEVSLAGERRLKITNVEVGSVGIETHQMVLALLGAGLQGRLSLMKELAMVLFSMGDFRNSREELTPTTGDPITFLVLFGLFLMLFVHGPSGARSMTVSAVSKYALSPEGWEMILKSRVERNDKPRG